MALPKSATTSWIQAQADLRRSSREKHAVYGMSGWVPCPSRETDLDDPNGEGNSPIRSKISMFETLNRSRRDKNNVGGGSAKDSGQRSSADHQSKMRKAVRRLSPSFRCVNAERASDLSPLRPVKSAVSPTDSWTRLRKKASPSHSHKLSSNDMATTSHSCHSEPLHCVTPLEAVPLLQVSSAESLATSLLVQHKDLGPSGGFYPSHIRGSSRHSLHGSSASWLRKLSWSDHPTIASAHCTLEHPRPVKGGEMRRLVSLCRDKVSGRLLRASE